LAPASPDATVPGILDLDPHSLIGTLYAFYLEHERCGELDSAVEDERVWMRRWEPAHR